MAYKIKVKDVEGVIHTVETATELAGKTASQIFDIACKIIGVGGAAASMANYVSHEKKDETTNK